MKEFRVGVVGLGHRGREIGKLTALFPGLNLVAACDIRKHNWYETQWLSTAPMAEIFLDAAFYEDYEKIQLVLGDNSKEDEFKFILDRQVKVKDIFNGNPDVDLPEKAYSIQHSAFMKLESYKQIGRGL